jgi:uncharacterized Zn finger protein
MGLHYPLAEEVNTIWINDGRVARRIVRGVEESGADVVVTKQHDGRRVEVVGTNQAIQQVFLAMDKLKSRKKSE